ncbi:enoyl-CoA hydratase/isomerase family protein [Sphingomonas koreensis]|uniref:enoyl-CoA hydratase/isomerase family protein n=1 Tax=Sphingomonas koreensis TaxID=93064 RepID=UPI00082A66D5|nr:enoyl-CoA hydratase/isomerase family protein [Sphingomonas koreensis]PJI89357.1 enoyl-CoA hydratase [Sphingomonas koreensis]RSU59222.1 enoyl-CoA hydratase/isomerase family protein [Sphingomonas koreensis]RSU68262.1 enoyl-CoA hydratase/isomerase family protein [Sphingomonas koreensis]
MTDDLLFTVADHVATITLNRPAKLNALTPEMAAALIASVSACNSSDAVRCVVITGAGEKAFSAGSDITTLDGYATPWDFRNRDDYCDALRACRKPVVAAINGYALGGGLETAMAADIRIASTNARFAAPEIKLGWIGGGGMAAGLTYSMGASNAALMLFTGDMIDAEKALAWGLVSEVVAPDALLARAQEIARTIASRAPIAAETAKLNLRAAHTMPWDKAIEYERDLQAICFATDDAKEGRAAFAEKRAPVFRRR